MKIPANKPDSLSDSLDNVMIAAPCNIGWDNMVGDDRVRLCAGCDKNVYNTSRMTKAEIKELLAVEGKAPCLRIYRRADGTMLTEDCPVGLRRVRDAWQRLAKVAASIWACALTVTSSWAQTVQQKSEEQAPPPSVDSIDVVGQLPDFESIKKLQTLQNAKKSATGADRSAMDLFNQAKTAQNEKKKDEADQLFTRATAALEQGTHDPKFVELIYQNYAEFLRTNGKPAKANETLKLLVKYKSEHYKTPEPTVIDGRPSSGRSERRQKTSPTLPEGAPVPDNE